MKDLAADLRKDMTPPQIAFLLCSLAGISLLVARWVYTGELTGFFLMLFLTTMFLLRRRVAWMRFSVILDVAICMVLSPVMLALPLFWGMYYRVFIILGALFYFAVSPDLYSAAVGVVAAAAGLFLGNWRSERIRRQQVRDEEAGRYYQLETLQSSLMSATAQVERMTAISERARIAREIHDNAGHEIVAAYMSLQAIRDDFSHEDADTLTLFDAALERLDSGTQKIRETVHNLAPVAALGVDNLRETCARFTTARVQFTAFGDSTHVPVYVWNALEACLNEALTNAARHARPKHLSVELDMTPKLVRMCVENDGVSYTKKPMGTGLRNLRYRMVAIGGNLSVDAGEDLYRLVCFVPVGSGGGG
ncbi:MAG: histidine kinase [Defluviitaleaceae bacterium]|nr:histidine kinase [Defluviitaleaceae bacterium]